MKVPVVQTIHNFRLLCPGATFYRDGHICEDCVEHGLRCAIKHRLLKKGYVVIEHRKIKAGESFRNLHIYEQIY